MSPAKPGPTAKRCRRLLTTASAVTTTVLLLAACASSGTPSSHGNNPTQAQVQVQQDQQDAVRFSACMRSHGVANFPDPPTSAAGPSAGHAFKNAIASSAPAVQSAEIACQHFMPGGHLGSQTAAPSAPQTAALLTFAHCLHSHGFPNFPDPNSSGQITHEMIANAGIDLRQPATVQAADECVGGTHGVVTRATVARFLAGH
jgi:hypothetical protein